MLRTLYVKNMYTQAASLILMLHAGVRSPWPLEDAYGLEPLQHASHQVSRGDGHGQAGTAEETQLAACSSQIAAVREDGITGASCTHGKVRKCTQNFSGGT